MRNVTLSLLFVLWSAPAAAQTYTESGDTGPSANASAQDAGTAGLISGDLETNTDTDVFAVQLAADEVVTVSLCNDGGSTSMSHSELFLFDSGGSVVAQNDNNLDRCTSGGGGSEFIYTVPTTGTYYVGVCAYQCTASGGMLSSDGETAYPEGAEYVISVNRLASVPYTESGDAGNAVGTAQDAGTASLVNGDLDDSGADADVFAVALAANEVVTISLCNDGGNTAIDGAELFLFDASGSVVVDNIGSDDCPGGNTPEIVYLAPSPGTYYVGVCAVSCSASGGALSSNGASGQAGDAYTLSIRRAALVADYVESGDTGNAIDTAQDAGTASLVGGDLDGSDADADVFAVTLYAGPVTVSVCNDGGSTSIGDTELFLFDASGSVVAAADDSFECDYGRSSEFFYTVPSPGTYYVGVCSYNCSASGGAIGSNGVHGQAGDTYVISVRQPPPPDYTESGDAGDATGTAQDAGTASLIGGDLDDSGADADVFAVELQAGSVTVSLCNDDGSSGIGDPALFLFDGSSNVVAQNGGSDNCADGWHAELTYQVPSAGRYYVGVCAEDCIASGGTLTGSTDGGSIGDTYVISLSGSAVLPVELVSFEAVVDGPDVRLRWQTASEVNNAGFEVQRAASGYGPGMPGSEWQTLAFVEGHGTTTEALRYSFRDADVPFEADVLRYRLRQVDYDGAFAYSPELEVAIEPAAVVALHGAYPNPFNPTTAIRYALPAASWVRLVVYDMLGREVAVLVDEQQPAGGHEVVFGARSLPSGVYVYRLHVAGHSLTRTMLLLK